ncbi:unnamed protein product [Caenorhabditis sp. 36 PRJEB53466]|nr:unnamed protein product [Caenorhabditis sp. 36 PRJEB53466]
MISQSVNAFFWILLYSLVAAISPFSLLDRVHRKDVRTSIPDFRTSDADVGMRSAHYIGSFRGEPIKTRQHHAFIDDNGVPIPLLPFADRFSSAESAHESEAEARAMARERKMHKWASERGGLVAARNRHR